MNSQVNTVHSKGRTTRNFLAVMDFILHGMSKAQAGGDCCLKSVPLKLGGQWVVVDIICPLLFVINDGNKVISFAAVQTVITEVRLGTIGHVIVFSTICWTILMPNVHFFARILSMMHVERSRTICSTSSQCTESTAPSTASKWALILMACSCVLSLTSCILCSMVSSCMFLSHSRNV
jgi:hypothetical protein